MKRLLSILFLGILLFNFYGYGLMIDCMAHNDESRMQTKLDQSAYSDAELISIKTKLNLPYYTGSGEFERTWGSIQVNGMYYQYVKRKVSNDTLELLCLPDPVKTKLTEAKNDFIKIAAAPNSTQLPQKDVVVKVFLPDFFQEERVQQGNISFDLNSVYSSMGEQCPTAGYYFLPEVPPDAVQACC